MPFNPDFDVEEYINKLKSDKKFLEESMVKELGPGFYRLEMEFQVTDKRVVSMGTKVVKKCEF